MKAISGFLIAAIILALAGGVCLAAGMLDNDMARAQQDVAAMHYEAPEATYDAAERYFEYASRLPGVGNGPLNDVRARKAALQDWRQQYSALVPVAADPVADIPADNLELQLIVANAVYRGGRAQAKDRPATLKALDAGIAAYLTVLKNAERHENAAYNYEYLVRLRDDIAKGRRKIDVPELGGPNGRDGSSPLKGKDEFKIYVPLDSEDVDSSASGAGKAAPIKRKG